MGVNSFVFLMFNDVPGEIRTPDLQICSLLLSFVRLVSSSPIFREHVDERHVSYSAITRTRPSSRDFGAARTTISTSCPSA